MGENGNFVGKGVYFTTTKQRAKIYGESIVTAEVDKALLLKKMDNWLAEYKNRCLEIFNEGTPVEQVNEKTGIYYQDLALSNGFKGIQMSVPMGTGSEVVVYDLSAIRIVS